MMRKGFEPVLYTKRTERVELSTGEQMSRTSDSSRMKTSLGRSSLYMPYTHTLSIYFIVIMTVTLACMYLTLCSRSSSCCFSLHLSPLIFYLSILFLFFFFIIYFRFVHLFFTFRLPLFFFSLMLF